MSAIRRLFSASRSSTVNNMSEERLLKLYTSLSEADRHTLLAFAEFLSSGVPRPQTVMPQVSTASAKPSIAATQKKAPEPAHVPRPEGETVVAALRRLSTTYHMLSKSKMLNVTSTLMSQHIMEGRDANEVIDELERLFEEQYQALRATFGDDT